MSTYFPPLQKVDELKRPAEIGQMYLVPSIITEGNRILPVLLPAHDEQASSGNARRHFHYDTRFLHLNIMDDLLAKVLDYNVRDLFKMPTDNKASIISSIIRVSDRDHIYNPFMCYRDFPKFPDASVTEALTQAYLGQKAQNKRCVHQGLDLSQVPIKDNCRTCPLHGLCYNERDEVVRKQK